MVKDCVIKTATHATFDHVFFGQRLLTERVRVRELVISDHLPLFLLFSVYESN